MVEGSVFSLSIASRTGADSTVAFSARFSVARISGGVPVGAMMPSQLPALTGTPCSAMVFRSGAPTKRLGAARPSDFSLPPLMKPSAAAIGTIIASTCPATTASIAGAAPRNGTCSIWTFACCMYISIPTCEEPPTPQEAKVILPGRCAACAENSAMLLPENAGFTTNA